MAVLENERQSCFLQKRPSLDDYMEKAVLPTIIDDEYKEYNEATRNVFRPLNVFHWWAEQPHLPSMQKKGLRFAIYSGDEFRTRAGL